MAKPEKRDTEKLVHAQVVVLPIARIKANAYNPNEMTDKQFRLLRKCIEEDAFLQPILVTLYPGEDLFTIIDGEHRFEAMRLNDSEEITCIFVDPSRVDLIKQKILTVRMNNLRGKMNKGKFRAIASDVIADGRYDFEDLADEFGFDDESEFEDIWNSAREQVPDDPDAKREFDAAKGSIKSVDDISALLDRLIEKYGSTLPAHFMFIDYGGKESIWVKIPKKATLRQLKAVARDVKEMGITFDSALVGILTSKVFLKWIEKYKDQLEPITETETVEDLL